ncbi:thiamine-phosphate kinase [Corynebacterium caspium]|uniref:thiamine-phosphate kinase n=1 Tax=Corynebacterium caspium TaxID=234828 RepID=UPI00037146D7|nr:thiamine-phosphate kinase [Corynebacterium caspium]WKD59397.1 Thiamine-monophosphate kinase [Corynebacterium caspium DSM 44850]
MINQGLTVGEVGEIGVIEIIRAAAKSKINGDDAAVLFKAPPNTRTVVTTDTLVNQRHFNLKWSTPAEIGAKAITQNFADIEAMGARPIAAVLALTLAKNTPIEFVQGLSIGIQNQLTEFSAELVGGDLTAGPDIVITITAIGTLGGSRPPLTLNKAKPGQRLVASGQIGYSAAGLALLEYFGRDMPAEFIPLRDAHTHPKIQPARGMIARATGATAATDNSDGLAVDTATLAKHSKVAIDLNPAAIKPNELLQAAADYLGTDPWQWILSGGEDHTILATTSAATPSGFRDIGTVSRGQGLTLGGKALPYISGWLSF